MKANNPVYKCALAVMALCTSLSAFAFSTSQYATKSKLSTGKWVKIEIGNSGMYQITFDELAAMGFSDPSKVRVYGHGGALISETLNGKAIDDLNPVPIGMSDDKIYFYANGTVDLNLNTNTTAPAFVRTRNHYANASYYFLTEMSGNANYIKYYATPSTGSLYYRRTSLGYYIHENEQFAYSSAGRDLFGESINSASFDKPTKFSVPLSYPVDSAKVTLQYVVAAYAKDATTMRCTFGDSIATFTSSTASNITTPSSSESYRTFNATATTCPAFTKSRMDFGIGFETPANLSSAYLDYFVVTYPHENLLETSQQIMGYNDLTVYDKVVISDPNESLQVWNITDKNTPTRMRLTQRSITTEVDETEDVQEFFYGKSGSATFVMFDPTRTLNKITSYEAISNQNIHGAATPDYVIVCPKAFREQAERLAQIHRDKEGMQVLVATQDEVFNEFSSGTPDASAIRLMMKMFYDRNSSKIKYLLMLGGGYFDNRQITKKKGDNLLLTFQSSTGSYSTYVSDDYFGLLVDKSGRNITSDKLCLGIGRLPVLTADEASDVIDKIESYINNSDYSNWRNKMLIVDEYGDGDIHTYQARGIEDLMANTAAKDIDIKRLHIAAYYPSSTKLKATDNTFTATLQFAEFLKQGAAFVTYMGHGGSTSLSKTEFWTTSNMRNTNISRMPVMSLAACDIANYDSNTRGIGEYMIITPNRGCVGLLTSTRSVESSENDFLNTAFIKALYTTNTDGSNRTLGEAYKEAKAAYETIPSRNKMCFTLFADPALKLAYPKSYIKVSSLNGKPITDTQQLKAMTKAVIEGTVCNASGNTNTQFNGEVTVSLYNVQTLFKNEEYSGNALAIYHNRPLLGETTAKVENGKFTATVLVPMTCTANNTAGLISIYAHNTDNTTLADAAVSNFTFGEYDETDPETVVDTEAPVVEKMYINDETDFANDMNVASSFTLHALITDDNALSNQSQTIGKKITLVLDGKTTYSEVSGFAAVGNDGKSMNIAMPITSVSEGQHTLKITVYDAAGNNTSQTISFIVVPSQTTATLTTDTNVAKEKVTFTLNHAFTTTPSLKIYVMNNKNEIVWAKTTTDSTCEWDLTDASGNRLPAGVYQYYGTAYTSSQSAGTAISQIVVIDKQ